MFNGALWHSQLGHPSLFIQHLVSQNKLPLTSKVNSSLCHSCPSRKSHKLPFKLSSSETSGSLDLVHSDVWMSPLLSISGFRYFVDDFLFFLLN